MRKDELELVKKNASFVYLGFLSRLYRNWHFFMLSCIVSVICACVVERNMAPEYSIKAALLFSDESRGINFTDPALAGLGGSTLPNNVDNEVEILRSRTLMDKVVRDLSLNVIYLTKHLFGEKVISRAPFSVKPVAIKDTNYFNTYDLVFIDHWRYKLFNKHEKFNGTFGQTIDLPHGKFKIEKSEIAFDRSHIFSFRIIPLSEAVNEYRAGTSIVSSKVTSLVNISLKAMDPRAGEEILNTLISAYLRTSINLKNRIEDSTIVFIDRSLVAVSAELKTIEQAITQFRKANQLLDFEQDGRFVRENLEDFFAEERKLRVQLKILDILKQNPGEVGWQLIPSSLLGNNDNFVDLAKSFNELQLARRSILSTTSPAHPEATKLDVQARLVEENLVDFINNQRAEILVGIGEIRKSIAKYSLRLRQIPAAQQQYLELKRKQDIQKELYQFLLRKRIETSIAKSSHAPNAEVIDEPKADAKPIKPNFQLIMSVALILGLAIPFGVIYFKDMFQTHVVSKDEIAEASNMPVLAEIGLNVSKKTGDAENPSSILIREHFRILRSNIHFLSPGNPFKKIIITSGISGEGKSFVARNVSEAFALAGKKVVLVEMDLRKPTFYKHFNIENRGITDFLNAEKEYETVIQKTNSYPSIDILTSGPASSFSTEMLLSSKIGELVKRLERDYDFVVIDTPPIGITADARILGSYADLCLFVVRQNFSLKTQLTDIRQYASYFPSMCVIFNGIRRFSSYQYNYGYGLPARENLFSAIRNKLKIYTYK